jgi:hypothetical protein
MHLDDERPGDAVIPETRRSRNSVGIRGASKVARPVGEYGSGAIVWSVEFNVSARYRPVIAILYQNYGFMSGSALNVVEGTFTINDGDVKSGRLDLPSMKGLRY